MKNRQKKLETYIQALPGILQYQIFTKILIGLWLLLMGRVFRLLLNSTGRVAVSTGDFVFLFTRWQGILIVLCAVVSLYVYVALDLNAKIVLSRDLLSGEKISAFSVLRRALPTIQRFNNWRGIGVILYIVLIAPILGVGVSLTMTKGLYIPTFISSVIADTPLYLVDTTLLVLVFLSVGVANLFMLHGIVLDGLSIKEAGEQSKRLIRANWKDYLKQNVLFLLVIAVLLAAVVVVLLVLPLALVQLLPLSAGVRRAATVFLVTSGVLLSLMADLFATPLYLMKMTQLFYAYKGESAIVFHPWEKRKHGLTVLGIAIWLLAVAVASVPITRQFDTLFPQDSQVRVIAHRGGGSEGAENTVAGLYTAWEIGAYGSEIDIQRTKDGYYVLNHDGNFQRVAGVKQKPQELTLAEIKALSVDGEPVPTLEEALQASRGNGVLFIELKGETADQQMADDAVKIVKEYGMEQECVLISLKYGLIDYIEQNYPEIQTGYLTFASFGDTAKLNCDYLALEEESATADVISAVHKQGKKVLVWTANERESQKHFLCSMADGIITDYVTQATEISAALRERSDLQRMIDGIMEFIS
ncbi:MAG: glycerophosphoryl diester phosphodiesterase membrane domain-containing protein [Oscillospiraceae bacterium]|nr:glycerophosphoryl diester phosphodiesterase membrane domain-containing protein [Oscillospiraceae bacterium]